MSPASPNEKIETDVNEAGTSQTAPPDTAKIIQDFSANSAPSSPVPQLQPIALPARRQTLRMDANQIKTPPQDTISPLGLDACGLVPQDAWCCDEFYDWTAVYVPSFCNWPQQSQDSTAQPCWTQAQQMSHPLPQGMPISGHANPSGPYPNNCYQHSTSPYPKGAMTLHASVNFGQAV